jgi:phospholipid/cholesterol/gamma-HCH transport system substrate-binding protein
LVGVFVLVAAAGLFVFVIWLSGADRGKEYKRYRVEFEESVQGLGIGGTVTYRGLQIGSISDISVDPDKPTRVGVIIQIRSDVPIREGDIARLRFQGLTGVATINIEGSKAGQPLLEAASEDEFPLIPSRVSHFQRLLAKAPELLSTGVVLAERAADLLNDENQALFTGILRDVKTLTGALAARTDDLDQVLVSVESASANLAASARGLRGLTERANVLMDEASLTMSALRDSLSTFDGFVEEDARLVARDVRSAARSVDRMSREIASLVDENEGAVRAFAEEGLPEITRFAVDARILVINLARLAERLENTGTNLLFGEPGPEYKPK